MRGWGGGGGREGEADSSKQNNRWKTGQKDHHTIKRYFNL